MFSFLFRHGLHGFHGFSCPCVSVVVPTDAMTRIFNRLDESVSSKQAEGLRKAEDGFRAIRDVLLRTLSEKIRA